MEKVAMIKTGIVVGIVAGITLFGLQYLVQRGREVVREERNLHAQLDDACLNEARVKMTKANLKALHSAVNQFRMDVGRFPKEGIGLIELVKKQPDVTNWQTGGYLESTEIPLDVWGNPFIYEVYPPSGKPFYIRSAGPDREKDTEDDLLSTDF